MNPDAKRFGRGTKFISVMDILNNQFICYDNIRASVEVVDGDIETYGVNYGDILFQRSSETLEDVGQANVYLDSKPAVFGGFVIRGKSKSNYYPMFFRYLLASPTARKKIIVKGAGAQHFNIGQDGLSKVCLNIPSIQEQEKIAKLFECIDTRIATQNKIIEDLKKLKSAIIEKTFNAGEKVALARIEKKNMQFLYEMNGTYYFMNMTTYEQIELDKSLVEYESKFLKENLEVIMMFYGDEVLGITLPDKVVMKVVRTEAAVKGNTTNSAMKDAEVETGLVVKVPLFINQDEEILISTKDGKYVSRA